VKYISVCSGIEAASVAWEPLGWEPVAFSEIEPFPAAVLKHHWPEVPNHGDMNKYEQWNIPGGTVDLLVGGTPCQSFSVAGLRKGLDDPRGGLMLTFLKIAQRFQPRWIVWENVPGVLSSNGGRDFGSFLGALGELGYGWAYRVLDAQWFGVAQRRRRVFVVGCLGDGAAAAKVLFESESVRRDSPPSREKGKGVAADAQEGVGVSLPEREVVGCLSDGAHMGGGLTGRTPTPEELWQSQAFRMQAFGEYMNDETASAMKARDYKDATDLVAEKKSHWDGSVVHPTLSQALKSSGGIGFSNQEIFSQGGSGLVQAIPIHDQATRNAGKRGDRQDGKGNGLGVGKPGDPCPTLTKGDKHAVLYENHPNDSRVTGPHEVAPACVSRFGTGGGNVPLVQEAVPVNIYGGNKRKDRPNGGFYANVGEETSKTLDSASGLNPACNQGGTAVVQETIAFQESELRLTGKITEQKVVPTLKAGTKGGDTEPKVVAFEPGIASREGNESRFVEEMSPTLRKDMGDNQVATVDSRMAVRRLTPKECERLQGFPDNHTLIPWRGKPADQCPDGPRYKALGNSMAVPCMAWIGKRIAKAEHERQGAA
jgi:DNA (cytosine-5)-methyltransferase 1